VGYARISTDDQTTALQADTLTRAAVDVVFEEEASGANTARPVLAKTLAALRPRDTLVVWRLDRLGRSLGHLIEVATVLREPPRRLPGGCCITSWARSRSSSARSSKSAPLPA
jgi:DNA invertase Pin-like site-specific DNA recombinase